MSHSFRRTLTFATAMVMLAGVVGTASAETTWQKNHPRRTQVNHRLHNQNRRIHNDVKNGTLSQEPGGEPAQGRSSGAPGRA